MKNTNSQKLRLGSFVLIGTILFIAGVYLIGQRQNMFKKTFTLSSYFQNVNGLQKGNNVRYSGINIGTVKDITMVNDSTIKVDMAIEEKIISHIKKNSIATIGSDGLVGYYFTYQEAYFNPQYFDAYNVFTIETSLYSLHISSNKSRIWYGRYDMVDQNNVQKSINSYVKAVIKTLKKEELILKK